VGEDREIDRLASPFGSVGSPTADGGAVWTGLAWQAGAEKVAGVSWEVRLEMQAVALNLAALGWRSSPYARRIS
jgi:hypothetical protein